MCTKTFNGYAILIGGNHTKSIALEFHWLIGMLLINNLSEFNALECNRFNSCGSYSMHKL